MDIFSKISTAKFLTFRLINYSSYYDFTSRRDGTTKISRTLGEVTGTPSLVWPGEPLDMGEEKVKAPLVVLFAGLFARLSAAGLPEDPLDTAEGVDVFVAGVKPKLNDGATTGSVNSVDKAGTSTCSTIYITIY